MQKYSGANKIIFTKSLWTEINGAHCSRFHNLTPPFGIASSGYYAEAALIAYDDNHESLSADMQ